MSTLWEETGLQFGSFSQHDYEAGGRWTVGDRFSEHEPGYSRTVRYKSWYATNDKYEPGKYEFKNRAEESMWEYVLVMRNTLIATERHDQLECEQGYQLSSGDYILFPPSIHRAWKLLSPTDTARGVTLLTRQVGTITKSMFGGPFCGFVLRPWTNTNAAHYLNTNASFRRKYIEVFAGTLRCNHRDGVEPLSSDSFVYVDAQKRGGTFTTNSVARGIVLYYN